MHAQWRRKRRGCGERVGKSSVGFGGDEDEEL